MRARLRSAAMVLTWGFLGLWGCPRAATDGPESRRRNPDDGRRNEGDPRVDPSHCTGEDLELVELVRAGLCTIPVASAQPLPEPEILAIEAPQQLRVAPGERLEFDLFLRNEGAEPLTVDLRFRHLLPLPPEETVRLDEGSGPDASCTMRAISTEPPPERVTLPPDAELAIPCEWFANTRLIDPHSYVGSECPDFPALEPGRYRSIFRISGGAGTWREVAVEIEVRAP